MKIYEYEPEDFIPLLTIVGCYCTCQGRILLLKRHPETFSPEKWCLPAGKLEPNESRLEGARRELHEETGLTPKNLIHLGTVYLSFPDYAYDFAIYHAPFEKEPALHLDLNEHTEALWVTHDEALQLPLIQGGDRILNYCKKSRS